MKSFTEFLMESQQDIVDVIWGAKRRKGQNPLFAPFEALFNDKNRFDPKFDTESTFNHLKRAGLSRHDSERVRDVVVDAYTNAIKKFGIPLTYVDKNDKLYFAKSNLQKEKSTTGGVVKHIRKEFSLYAQKQIELKLRKLNIDI